MYVVEVDVEYGMQWIPMEVDGGYDMEIIHRKFMSEKYHLHQFFYENTINQSSNLDLCFINTTLKYSEVWNYWSNHRTLLAAVKVNISNNNKDILCYIY